MNCKVNELIAGMPQLGQRQDGTDAQAADVERFLAAAGFSEIMDLQKSAVANRMGAYDAADLFKLRAQLELQTERAGR